MDNDDNDDAKGRPKEAEVMALLEQMLFAVERSQGFIQDDGKISRSDKGEIIYWMMRIRSLSLEVDHLLGM